MSNHLIITIPQYIRKVKMSEKQLPIYYEYKNGLIKAKNKDLPDKYLTEEGKKNRILNEGKISEKDLKTDYVLRTEKNNRIFLCYSKLAKDKNNKLGYELVLANPLKVGTPRMIVINAQSIFSGNLREHEKEAVMLRIKKSFVPFIQNLKPIDFYPVRIRMYLYDTVKNMFDKTKDDSKSGMRWDVINRSWMYSKSFGDLLVEGLSDKSIKVGKILQDDERLFVTEDGSCVFMPIDNPENRRLVFIVCKDDENFAKVIEPYEKEHQWLIKNNKFYKEIQEKWNKKN